MLYIVAAAPPVGKRPLFKTQLSVPVDFHPKVTPEIHRSKSHPGVLKDLNKEQVPENKPNVQAKIRAKDGRRKKCGKKQYSNLLYMSFLLTIFNF